VILLKFKQHLIYLVGVILVAYLVNQGFFVAISLFFVYFKRFPKTYWTYIGVSILAFGWLRLALATGGDYVLSENTKTYEAVVLEIKRQSSERQTAIIEINSLRVYLTYGSSEPKLLPGDVIEVIGQLKEPANPTVPHQFNFKHYLKTERVDLTLYTSQLSVVEHQWSIWQYQYQMVNWIEERYPPLTSTYLQSFFFGVRDGIDEQLTIAYEQLGIVHLFAISGLHVNLLTQIFRYCLKRLGIIQNLVNILLIGFLIIFIILAGGSSSIVRAGIMAILSIVNKQFKWHLSAYDMLSILFIGNFLINPLKIYQIGFIFSYWITFILISFQTILQALTTLKKQFFIPFIAQISALPIQLAHSYELNLAAYIVNLIMIPLVTSTIIPMLLVTLLIPRVAILTEKILIGFERLNLWCAQWLNIPWVFGSLSLSTILLLMVYLVMAGWYFEKTAKNWVWLSLVIIVIGTLELQRIFKPENQFTVLDVGQGDSLVIQSSYQRCTIVVDTGGMFSFNGPATSIFSQTLEPYLLGEGVKQIDYLILTHEDFDHIGEAIPLLQRFPVKTLVIGETKPTDLYQDIFAVAREVNTEIRIAKTGDVMTCSNQKHHFLQPEAKATNNNDNSLVIALELKGFTALLTGDIGFEVEADILKEYSLDHLDVYKVAHHGSKYSNSQTFLEALNPTYAVVSAGRNNLYGHPSRELLAILDNLDMPLLSTQDYGTIQVKITGNGFRIYTNPLF